MSDSGLYTLVDYGHTKPLKLSIDGHNEMGNTVQAHLISHDTRLSILSLSRHQSSFYLATRQATQRTCVYNNLKITYLPLKKTPGLEVFRWFYSDFARFNTHIVFKE
jgi:hypothetical protein